MVSSFDEQSFATSVPKVVFSQASRRIAALKERCVKAKVPVIYVNDNFGRWRSDFKALLRHCLSDESVGKSAVTLIKPLDTDYFVLKPKHSGFFSTSLHTLLDYLQVRTLILTGLTGDICVLFTANDAYMRDYALIVPRDCVASKSERDNQTALAMMRRVLKASTVRSKAVRLSGFK